jgi:hypothetical protein
MAVEKAAAGVEGREIQARRRCSSTRRCTGRICRGCGIPASRSGSRGSLRLGIDGRSAVQRLQHMDRGEMFGCQGGLQGRGGDGVAASQKGAMHTGFASEVGDGGQLHVGAGSGCPDCVGNGGQLVSGYFPLVRSARRVGVRRGEQALLLVGNDCQVAAADRDHRAFIFFQFAAKRGGIVRPEFSYPDLRTARGRGCLRNHDGWSQPRRSETEPGRQICSRRVVGRAGLGGNDNLARDEIGNAIAVGVGQHPTRGERIGHMVAGRRRLFLKRESACQRQQQKPTIPAECSQHLDILSCCGECGEPDPAQL